MKFLLDFVCKGSGDDEKDDNENRNEDNSSDRSESPLSDKEENESEKLEDVEKDEEASKKVFNCFRWKTFLFTLLTKLIGSNRDVGDIGLKVNYTSTQS